MVRNSFQKTNSGTLMAGIEQAQENVRDFGLAAQAPAQPDLSQYDAEGMRAIARGFENLNATMFSIRERKAEAKNYVDVTEADTAMMKLRGEFDKWKLANPDPSGWEEKWNSLSTNFSNNYLSDKDISPKARDEITAKMNAFTTREAIAVGVDSVKGQVQKAQAAVRANIDFAISRGDLAGAMKNLQIAEDEGWMHADEVMRERLRIEDAIEDQKLDELKATIIDAKNRGNRRVALEAISEAEKTGLLSPKEAKAQKSTIQREIIYLENVEALSQAAAVNPEEVYANLKDGKVDGIYNLTPVDRNQFSNRLEAQFANEYAATVARLVEIYPVLTDDLWQDETFKILPESYQRDVVKRINEGALNDGAEYWDLKSKIELLDPEQPDFATQLARYRHQASIKFSDQRYDTIIEMINDREENPSPPAIASRILSGGLQIFDESVKNGSLGTYQYEFDEIIQEDIVNADGASSGRKGFFVLDKNAPADLRYQESDKKFIFFGGGFRLVESDYEGKEGDIFYRQITLTKEQELAFADDKKTLYTDLTAKRAIDEKALQAKGIVEREVELGEITSGPQVLSRINELTMVDEDTSGRQLIEKAEAKLTIEQELNEVIARQSEPLVRAVPIPPADSEDADSAEEGEDQTIFYGPDGAISTEEDKDSREQGPDTVTQSRTYGTLIVPGASPDQKPESGLFPDGLLPEDEDDKNSAKKRR